MNAINKRRSTRRYKDGLVTDEQIKEILKAGMCAPSAHNQQPYRFVVIRSQEIRNQIAEVHPYAKMLKFASVAMLVYFNQADLKSPEFVQQDLSASIENMLIEATDLDVGSCWIGVYPNEKLVSSIREIVDLAESSTPFSLVSFGLPEAGKEGHDRFIEEWVTYK